MKKQMAIAIAVMCGGVLAALTGLELKNGANMLPGAGRIVAAQARGSEAGSQAIVKIVTPFDREEYTTAVVTNRTYRPAMSNVTYTVSNTLWQAWSTNALAAGGVATNLIAEAWGGRPTVAGWPTNILIYTSKLAPRTLSSNVTYQVVDTIDVRTERKRNVMHMETTNTLWSVVVYGGEVKTTNGMDKVFFPGDFIVGEGLAFEGGKVQLILER